MRLGSRVLWMIQIFKLGYGCMHDHVVIARAKCAYVHCDQPNG